MLAIVNGRYDDSLFYRKKIVIRLMTLKVYQSELEKIEKERE